MKEVLYPVYANSINQSINQLTKFVQRPLQNNYVQQCWTV